MELTQLTLGEWIVFGLIFLTVLFLIFGYIRFFKITKTKQQSEVKDKRPISVVIATRDEQEQLRLNLPFFLQQDYPEFEIVVVIDDSDKDMIYIMREFEKEYKNLKIVNFEWSRNFFMDRKFAESIGIKAASYDHILLSNIDTRPSSPQWVSQMQDKFKDNKQIVIGYSTFVSNKSFMNSWIRFDNFLYTLQYMSAALRGKAFTADRKNLAFDRNLFYEAKGVAEFYNVDTGDEDMFVNKAVTPNNVDIQVNPDSYTKTQKSYSFSEWFNKKKRHQIILREFKSSTRLNLSLGQWLNFLFYLSVIFALILYFIPLSPGWTVSKIGLIAVAVLFLIKCTTQIVIFKKLMSLFQEKGFLFWIPLFELMMLIAYPSVKLASLFTKRIKWK